MEALSANKVFRARKLFSAVISTLFIVSNLSLCALDATIKVSGHSASEIKPLQLHSAPNFAAPAQGLRESSPEEIQRLEQLGGRDKLSRTGATSGFSYGMQLLSVSAHAFYKPLLLLENLRLNANLKSLAHTHLAGRYPIPPPQTSV
jgi:hypothetical protein